MAIKEIHRQEVTDYTFPLKQEAPLPTDAVTIRRLHYLEELSKRIKLISETDKAEGECLRMIFLIPII